MGTLLFPRRRRNNKPSRIPIGKIRRPTFISQQMMNIEQQLFADREGEESDSDLEDHIIVDEWVRGRPKRDYEKRKLRGNSEDSLFYTTYLAQADEGEERGVGIWDPTSKEGLEFWSLFHYPFIFVQAVTRQFGLDHPNWRNNVDCCGMQGHDLRLYMLAAFRMMAKGCSYVELRELTFIAVSSLKRFVDDFFFWGATKAAEHIKLPGTPDEIRDAEREYSNQFLPGAIGSMDAFHIFWGACPAGMKSSCKNKRYKYPSVAFNVCCSNKKKIWSVTTGFVGNNNDKTLVKFDPIIDVLRNGELSEYRWGCLLDFDEYFYDKGLYLICDGGYLEYKELICPSTQTSPDHCAFSKNLESVRKDIETLFGILRKRNGMIRNCVTFHDMEQIVRMFHTICWLHNELLEFYDDTHLVEEIDDFDVQSYIDDNYVIETDVEDCFLEIADYREFIKRQERLVTHYGTCCRVEGVPLMRE